MSLKTGDWKMNQDGIETKLSINTVVANGTVTGQLSTAGILPGGAGVNFLAGLWDETSRTLTFAFPHTVQLTEQPRYFYKGFLFSTPRTPTPGIDVVWTLAGYVEVWDNGVAEFNGGNARRNVFGWFAQITEVA